MFVDVSFDIYLISCSVIITLFCLEEWYLEGVISDRGVVPGGNREGLVVKRGDPK